MSKVLFALLIVSCVFGVWNYFQSADEIECLRKNLEARESEVKGCRSEISNLRDENERLQVKISNYDKWVKTRSNFELNKVQLKIKFDQIIQDFREAEALWAHIDETPNTTSEKGQSAATSNASGAISETNSIPISVDVSLPQHDGSKRAGATLSSERKSQRARIKRMIIVGSSSW